MDISRISSSSRYEKESATHLLDLAQQPRLTLLARLGTVVPRAEAGELDQIRLHDICGELGIVVGCGVCVGGGVLGQGRVACGLRGISRSI
jgi:hypothetical protein